MQSCGCPKWFDSTEKSRPTITRANARAHSAHARASRARAAKEILRARARAQRETSNISNFFKTKCIVCWYQSIIFWVVKFGIMTHIWNLKLYPINNLDLYFIYVNSHWNIQRTERSISEVEKKCANQRRLKPVEKSQSLSNSVSWISRSNKKLKIILAYARLNSRTCARRLCLRASWVCFYFVCYKRM